MRSVTKNALLITKLQFVRINLSDRISGILIRIELIVPKIIQNKLMQKKEHEKILDSIQPYLVPLQDAQLHKPATSIASVILSKVVERKSRYEFHSKNRDNPNFVLKTRQIQLLPYQLQKYCE